MNPKLPDAKTTNTAAPRIFFIFKWAVMHLNLCSVKIKAGAIGHV